MVDMQSTGDIEGRPDTRMSGRIAEKPFKLYLE